MKSPEMSVLAPGAHGYLEFESAVLQMRWEIKVQASMDGFIVVQMFTSPLALLYVGLLSLCV